MTTRLLSHDIWRKITAAAKKAPDQSFVAVAYFATGASKLLPLTEGSVLVVDASESAVRSGQTNPSDLLTLINRGVEVHSVRNLHAKVFVTGDQAFIGSTNVSRHSADGLVEAAIQTDSAAVVTSCRKFVKSLRGEFVSLEHAKNLQKIYKPPKFSGAKRFGKKKSAPQHDPVWIVPLAHVDWDAEDWEQEGKGLPKAETRLRSSRYYSIDEFCCLGGSFSARVKLHDVLIQVIEESKGRYVVAPPCRVIHVQRYSKGNAHRAIVFLERLKRVRERNLKTVIKRLGAKAQELGKQHLPKRLRNQTFVHALLNLWSLSQGR